MNTKAMFNCSFTLLLPEAISTKYHKTVKQNSYLDIIQSAYKDMVLH